MTATKRKEKTGKQVFRRISILMLFAFALAAMFTVVRFPLWTYMFPSVIFDYGLIVALDYWFGKEL